jgi:hypothetical protein
VVWELWNHTSLRSDEEAKAKSEYDTICNAGINSSAQWHVSPWQAVCVVSGFGERYSGVRSVSQVEASTVLSVGRR